MKTDFKFSQQQRLKLPSSVSWHHHYIQTACYPLRNISS